MPAKWLLGFVFVLACSASRADSPPFSDVDGDRDVDLVDIGAFATCYGLEPGQDCLTRFDRDGDGDIDEGDLRQLTLMITGPDAPAGMVLIPCGSFDMGDHHGDDCIPQDDGNPVHTVYLDAFFMHQHEITNRQYAQALNWAVSQDPPRISVIEGVV